MKRKYLTWYRSCSDTKIKKKEKNTYLCNDKIPLAMILDCIYIHILVTIGNIDLRERMRNTLCMSPLCSYNHEEILGSD